MTLRTPSKDVMLVKVSGVVTVSSCSRERVRSLVRDRPRTKECRYEHGPQIPLYLGSLPDNLH